MNTKFENSAPQKTLRTSWKTESIMTNCTMVRKIHKGPVIRHTSRLRGKVMEVDTDSGNVTRYSIR